MSELRSHIERLHAEAEEAYRRAPDEQRSITYGDCFVREWRALGGMDVLVIYGEIATREWLEENEPQAVDAFDVGYQRGYRFGRCYSVVEPEGEWGSTHVTTMHRISRDEFNAAKARGWT